MKQFIRGLSRNESVVTRSTTTNKETSKPEASIFIGPNCYQCLLSVRDTNDISYCLRFHENICKYDSEDFNDVADKFRKKYSCTCGTYIFKKE
jgi:hypothetical protein